MNKNEFSLVDIEEISEAKEATPAENVKNENVADSLLVVRNLSVLIKDRFLVKNVSFTANKGDCFAFIGENRSGKSSLIKAISGSLPINPGQIFIDGEDLYHNKKILQGVKICLDPPVFFKYQTVFQNLKFLSSFNNSNKKSDIVSALNRFNMGHRLNTRVLFLTYHERKMMGLALAFLTHPKILLLDEPFKNIPEENLQIVISAIKDIKKQGTCVLITSQSTDQVHKLCDTLFFMQNREIVRFMEGEAKKDLENLETFAFVKVKYPHYVGKIIMEQFDLRVKLYGPRVLFDADEKQIAQIVRFLARNKIVVYGAGFVDKTAEKVFANLSPYYKEEQQ